MSANRPFHMRCIWFFQRNFFRAIGLFNILKAEILGREYIAFVFVEYKTCYICLPFPKRHHHCIFAAYKRKLLNDDSDDTGSIQGFITSEYRRVDRKEAKKVAIAAGQLLPFRRQHPTELFSEEIW